MQPDGLIWHSTPRATVGLVVSGGVVVDAPPYARKWALHRPAAELLNDPQADTAWIPERSSMTDTMPEQAPVEDEQDWSGPTSGETYPSYPDNPHNHRFTISFDGRGPMVVVRGNSKDDIIQAYNELEDHAVGAAMGNAWAALKAAAALGNGLGVTPVPQGAPAAPQAPQAPTPPPFGPNVSVPGAPGFQGPPAPGMPMPPAPAPGGFGGGQQQGNRGPKPRPADWPQVYKIDVPFQQKDQFKAFREQYKDQLRGKVAWAGGGNYWIHGEVAQSFASYNPVPA